MNLRVRVCCAGAWLLLFLAALPRALQGQVSEGPSFSCAHVTSQVSSLICTTPALAALDRELAVVFNNMRGQPIDHEQLRAEEDAWIAELHRDCSDVSCIEGRYQARLRKLRDASLRVASPATYDETRPFGVPKELQLQAEKNIGKACSTRSGLVDASIPGFLPAGPFPPIFGPGFVIVVRQADGRHFAFLLTPDSSKEQCLIRDYVALPSDVQASHFLQCSNIDPQLAGFGVRSNSSGSLAAFWIVEATKFRIERMPIKVMGVDRTIRCRQPESADSIPIQE